MSCSSPKARSDYFSRTTEKRSHHLYPSKRVYLNSRPGESRRARPASFLSGRPYIPKGYDFVSIRESFGVRTPASDVTRTPIHDCGPPGRIVAQQSEHRRLAAVVMGGMLATRVLKADWREATTVERVESRWFVLGCDGRHVTLGRHTDPTAEKSECVAEAPHAPGHAGRLAATEGTP
jgi:hypothetical protein